MVAGAEVGDRVRAGRVRLARRPRAAVELALERRRRVLAGERERPAVAHGQRVGQVAGERRVRRRRVLGRLGDRPRVDRGRLVDVVLAVDRAHLELVRAVGQAVEGLRARARRPSRRCSCRRAGTRSGGCRRTSGCRCRRSGTSPSRWSSAAAERSRMRVSGSTSSGPASGSSAIWSTSSRRWRASGPCRRARWGSRGRSRAPRSGAGPGSRWWMVSGLMHSIQPSPSTGSAVSGGSLGCGGSVSGSSGSSRRVRRRIDPALVRPARSAACPGCRRRACRWR